MLKKTRFQGVLYGFKLARFLTCLGLFPLLFIGRKQSLNFNSAAAVVHHQQCRSPYMYTVCIAGIVNRPYTRRNTHNSSNITLCSSRDYEHKPHCGVVALHSKPNGIASSRHYETKSGHRGCTLCHVLQWRAGVWGGGVLVGVRVG